jgi:hypothetical protein
MVMMGIEGDVSPGSGESGRTHGPTDLRFCLTLLSLMPKTSPSIPIITIISEPSNRVRGLAPG